MDDLGVVSIMDYDGDDLVRRVVVLLYWLSDSHALGSRLPETDRWREAGQ